MLLSNYSMALALGSIALVGSVAWAYAEQQENLATGTGNYMANIANAVNTYTFEAFAELAKRPAGAVNLTIGEKSVSVEAPLHPTVQDLINLGLLPEGYSDVSPLGLSFRVDLTPANCDNDLAACSIPGLVYSTQGYRDAIGRVRNDLLGFAVIKAGQDAGVSFAESPETITGMAASWRTVNPVAGQPAGVLAMQVGWSSLLAQSLNQFYRRDGTLNLTGPMDANRQPMSMVGDFQSVGSISAATDVVALGSVHGGRVSGGYLESSGKLDVAGRITGSQIHSASDIFSGGSIQASSYVYAAGAIVPSIDSSQKVTEGQSCEDPEGAIRSDERGRTLSCQQRVWRAASGSGAFHSVYFETGGSGAGNIYPGVCLYAEGGGGFYSGGTPISTDQRAGSVVEPNLALYGLFGFRQTDGYLCPPGTVRINMQATVGGGN